MTTIQVLGPEARAFYRDAMTRLREADIPFLVGGAYAFACYTGIERHTKDFDVFVKPGDLEQVLAEFARAGYETDVPFPHWLGKVHAGGHFVDVIFSSGNGVARVDDDWFRHATPGEVLGQPALLCPPEEMIWSKSFIQERERYDGADIAHLIRKAGKRLDWERLIRRFGEDHWRVLLGHLVLFGFVYPGDREAIPAWVMDSLIGRLQQDVRDGANGEAVCQGTLLSRAQYLVDVEQWGLQDARARADNPMTDEHIAVWTEGITQDGED